MLFFRVLYFFMYCKKLVLFLSEKDFLILVTNVLAVIIKSLFVNICKAHDDFVIKVVKLFCLFVMPKMYEVEMK